MSAESLTVLVLWILSMFFYAAVEAARDCADRERRR